LVFGFLFSSWVVFFFNGICFSSCYHSSNTYVLMEDGETAALRNELSRLKAHHCKTYQEGSNCLHKNNVTLLNLEHLRKTGKFLPLL